MASSWADWRALFFHAMHHPFNRAAEEGFPPGRRPSPTARALLAGALVMACLAAQSSPSSVFRWQDEGGRVHYGDRPAPGAAQLPLGPELARGLAFSGRVVKVFDGDTIKLDNGDKIRLLGINTPEIAHRNRPAEAGGEAAKAWLQQRLAGRTVRLEADASPRDKYGRRLAHVFMSDGNHVNMDLVREGLATTDIFPPDLKYVESLLAAERNAQMARKGIWGMAAYQPRPATAAGEREGWQRLVGTVDTVIGGRGQTRLKMREPLDIQIPNLNRYLFPSLETYVGARVEVRGWVSRSKNGLSVTVRHPGALVRLD